MLNKILKLFLTKYIQWRFMQNEPNDIEEMVLLVTFRLLFLHEVLLFTVTKNGRRFIERNRSAVC